MACKRSKIHFMLLIFMFILVGESTAESEADILLNFKESLSGDSALRSWNKSISPPCNGDTGNWDGLQCSNGSVSKIILENMGLNGLIDSRALAGLQFLKSFSVINNSFDGPMPDVKGLTSLRSLFLSGNNFTGEIRDVAFSGMNLLTVYLDENQFTGKIPKSLVELPKLVKLNLEGNQFEGEIPEFKQNGLAGNFSNNHFMGRIPASLSKMSAGSFQGNKGLCGAPLGPCKKSKKKILLIAIIVAAAAIAIAAIAAACFIIRRSNAKASQYKENPSAKSHKNFKAYGSGRKEVESPDHHGGDLYKKGDQQGKLHFVRNGRERFELQDLLRASAEVLGSGSFGSSYKAALMSGPTMVVKRFRQMNNVGKDEFHEHMRRIGRLSHPNLLPLVAFYYRKEEKLLISDFVENGSLASHLHSKRPPGQPGLDWPTRLKVIKGIARGLAYLYKELPGLTLPHGHLKSSNVILDRTFEPLMTDYALVPVVNKEDAQQFMVAYKSPEFTHGDRATRKSDVWSFGILILEMLTGKFPANYLKQGKGANADLASWVNSVVREEWTGEVFDKDMKGTRNGEGEMLKLLKIGMGCCEWSLERRWDMKEAVEKIEELKERDSEEDYSSYASEGEVYSSRAISEDDFSFSVTK